MTNTITKAVSIGALHSVLILLAVTSANADFGAAMKAKAQNDLNAMYVSCIGDAENGEPKCQNVMGVLHKIGRGGADNNPEQAASFFLGSCEGGYWKGCANLAGLYNVGKGVSQDPLKGASYIDKAYAMVKNIHVDVHPAMLVRAANVYMGLENKDQLKAFEGYVKYMSIALGLKSSVYGKYGADKGAYLSEHKETLTRRTWFVRVAKLRQRGTVSLAEPAPEVVTEKPKPPKDKSNAVFRDCTDCPEMVRLPTGSFTMGDAAARKIESGTHDVKINTPFAASRFEVSFEQWDRCVSGGGCKHRPDDKGWGRGKFPVINVSLEDVIGYLSWLSRKTGQTYRLPSETEWEYLARGGADKRWPWGDQPDGAKMNCRDCGGKWAGRQTAPVDSYVPNGYGVAGAIGNVWEMTRDCKNESYRGSPTDEQPWLTGDCSFVILRGASWDTEKKQTYVAVRNWMPTDSRHDVVGFRVVRELSKDDKLAQPKAPSKPAADAPKLSRSADASMAMDLVSCAALRNAEAVESNNSSDRMRYEIARDQLLDAAYFYLGGIAADRIFRKDTKTYRAKIKATGGQSSKLKMKASTCQQVLDDPESRYAFWQQKNSG
jgi:formylglycine-generating enzyme required for sulfatase activity